MHRVRPTSHYIVDTIFPSPPAMSVCLQAACEQSQGVKGLNWNRHIGLLYFIIMVYRTHPMPELRCSKDKYGAYTRGSKAPR